MQAPGFVRTTTSGKQNEKKQPGGPGCIFFESVAANYFAAVLLKRLRKRSTRPPMLSTDFWVPV
jgi:hypothetical protein